MADKVIIRPDSQENDDVVVGSTMKYESAYSIRDVFLSDVQKVGLERMVKRIEAGNM